MIHLFGERVRIVFDRVAVVLPLVGVCSCHGECDCAFRADGVVFWHNQFRVRLTLHGGVGGCLTFVDIYDTQVDVLCRVDLRVDGVLVSDVVAIVFPDVSL